ncbi:MAG: NmrA family NAD(P)-binding protein, partial [Longimicrobiales bacterium]|nr:NmrA family NAD(P)-binding protein [Longimicrobiales bacterium]
MSYVIIGGTGTVGSEVVQGLLEGGSELRVVTRSPEKLADVDVEVIEADMTDPTTFEDKFGGSSGMFLLNPVSQSELQEGLFALAEAKKAGVEHIVYVSVHDVEKGPHLPHFASKIAMEDALKRSGIDWTILRPNNFHQNDVWFREAMLEYGVYPQPLGSVGVSRVDVRDIAAAAVNAFEDETHRNRTYTLAGPDALTGEECAAIWGDALGRDISYGGDDLEAWEQQARQMMPAWMTY